VKLTFLGTGTSFGVPKIGCRCPVCLSPDPRDKRNRVGAVVEDPYGTRLLIDTPPELRLQLIAAGIDRVDAVAYTHGHADHTHGIDDLRTLTLKRRRRIDVYADAPTSRALNARFGYCFVTPAGSNYPPIVTEHRLEAGRPVTIEGDAGAITALPFRQVHGDIDSLGFRFGNLAYSADVSAITPESLPLLEGLDVWILDALRYRQHPSHFSVADALHWLERVKPKRAILTNMHSDLDYEKLRRELPPHVEPAHDRLTIQVAEASA
jgi:phosphoribosyl 1,2-cyclic phosphate phosphodiesterase